MTCLALLSLSGCASNPVEVPNFDALSESSVEIATPLRLPEFPSPASANQDVVTFTAADFAQITRYLIVAGGNYEAAQGNAAALKAQSDAYNSLLSAARQQQQFTEIREEQLERERRDHFTDNWFHRGVIILGILVAL